MTDGPAGRETRKQRLAASNDMVPIQGTVDVDIPADELWREFTRASFWPRWNKCFFWCRNKQLRVGDQLIWCFEPIRRWMIYKFPAIARIDEVEPEGPDRRVTWEVVALPGFYARHTYSVEDLGGGRSRFGSWEQACGWNFRLLRLFWLAHFAFVRDESLKGAQDLESVYKKSGTLDAALLRRRSYLLFWLSSALVAAAIAVATWFYVSYVRLVVQQMAPGVYVATGGGGNSLIVESKGELLVVDTKFPPGSSALRSWLDDNAGGLTATVVNTHYHYDHTQGNVLFPGSKIFAHRQTPRLMLARDGGWWRDGRVDFVPKQLIDDKVGMTVGDIEVEIEPIAPAHTHGDVVVILPRHDIIATGDLVFHTYYPFFDLGPGGADIPGMANAVRELAERYPLARFVPGHGPVASAGDLLRHADFLTALHRAAVDARAAGRSEDQMLGEFDMSKCRRHILPSFHDFKLSWATCASAIKAAYRLARVR